MIWRIHFKKKNWLNNVLIKKIYVLHCNHNKLQKWIFFIVDSLFQGLTRWLYELMVYIWSIEIWLPDNKLVCASLVRWTAIRQIIKVTANKKVFQRTLDLISCHLVSLKEWEFTIKIPFFPFNFTRWHDWKQKIKIQEEKSKTTHLLITLWHAATIWHWTHCEWKRSLSNTTFLKSKDRMPVSVNTTLLQKPVLLQLWT